MADPGQESVPQGTASCLPPGGDPCFDATKSNRMVGRGCWGGGGRGVGLGEAGKEGVHGHHENSVGHTEDDPQRHPGHKADHVGAQVWQSECPDFLQLSHEVTLTERRSLFELDFTPASEFAYISGQRVLFGH